MYEEDSKSDGAKASAADWAFRKRKRCEDEKNAWKIRIIEQQTDNFARMSLEDNQNNSGYQGPRWEFEMMGAIELRGISDHDYF